MYRWGGGCCWFGGASKFASFMHLKMVVCIGSDGLDDVFRCLAFWGGVVPVMVISVPMVVV